MTRRYALTAAFFLTVLVGFGIVTWGSSAGVFAWTGGGADGTAVQQPASGQPAPAIDVTATDMALGDPAIPVVQPVSSDSSTSDRSRDDDDDEREHHDDGDREHEDDD